MKSILAIKGTGFLSPGINPLHPICRSARGTSYAMIGPALQLSRCGIGWGMNLRRGAVLGLLSRRSGLHRGRLLMHGLLIQRLLMHRLLMHRLLVDGDGTGLLNRSGLVFCLLRHRNGAGRPSGSRSRSAREGSGGGTPSGHAVLVQGESEEDESDEEEDTGICSQSIVSFSS